MRFVSRKSSIVAAVLWAAVRCSSLIAAAEPELSALVPADSLLVVSVNRPLRALESPFVRDVAEILRGSAGYRHFLKSPQHARLGQALRFIEHSQGTDWQTAFGKLTAGGIILSVRVERIGGPAIVSVVVAADEESTLTRFVAAGMSEIKRQAEAKRPAQGGPVAAGAPVKEASPVVTSEYAGVACHRVGDGHFAQIGRRLFLSSHREALEALVDRQLGRSSGTTFEISESLRIADSRGNLPLVQVIANIRQLREGDAKLQEALKLPVNDVGALVLLGGYFDLLRHSDFGTAALVIEDDSLVARVRFPTGTREFTESLKGFFAIDENAAAAAPLAVPGAFFSASWYRDYARLWSARSELIPETVAKQMEEGNAQQRQQTGSIGMIDVVEMLGPHFRFVAAPQTETVYKTKLDERIPAFGVAIDVRDEAAFRERVFAPLNKIINSPIVVLFAEVGEAEHRGATLTTIRFREDEKSAGKMNKALYQFNPAFTLTHGHLVVGSTAEITRGIVEALDSQLSEPIAPSSGPKGARVTDTQQLSFREVLAYAKDYEPQLLRGAMLRHALTPEEAGQELEVLRKLLNRLGQITSQTTVGENYFDISVRLGGDPATADKVVRPEAP